MTTDNFHVFGAAIRKNFNDLAKGELFVAESDRDAIWAAYLAAFPEGTNPVFRERTEHDCSCCRSFIRSVGNVVGIYDGQLRTIWDAGWQGTLPSPYAEVADAMATYVRGLVVRDVFLTPFSKFGVEKNFELIDGVTHQWSHFSVDVPRDYVTRDADAKRGELRTTHAMLLRAVRELSPAAVETVAELIRDGAIYRGAEFKKAVAGFQALQAKFHGINDPKVQENLAWKMLRDPAARFRNTVIGTLVEDLTTGGAVEEAVRVYESKVAPQNYKRPTALITKAMVASAMKTITELGLEDALQRRHARLSDVSVNSVLFVDNAVQGRMKGGIENLLMAEVKPAPLDLSRAEEVDIETFLGALAGVTSLQLYLEGTHLSNFMSLTAPEVADSKSLFRWNNDFAWSYDGNVTDSIKEKVKKAGGKVEGVALRISLAWHNYDDLDLHVIEPNKNHIYFGNKSHKLDVDMNAGGGTTREPVENIRWVSHAPDGDYSVYVNQFSRRESTGLGFTVEVESASGLFQLNYAKGIPSKADQAVATITMKGGRATIKPAAGITSGSLPQEKWGLKTLAPTRVNSLILSPNHWDGNAVGNKHWFFILEGCSNPTTIRGLYNEFLSPKLEAHRKVFEVLGDKTKCPVVAEQMSGVGFSAGRGDKVTVVAMGPNLNKAYTIVF